MNKSFAESAISQRHDYARHAFTSTVGWFTFFITVNYASMGWLAGVADKLKGNYAAIVLISCVFITQNILGMIALTIMRKYFFRCNTRILETQAFLQGESISEDPRDLAGQTCLPLRLYSTMILLMITALAPVLIAWIMFPFVYPREKHQHGPNQAMQRTASKPAIYAVSVCHPRFGCATSCSGLAVADLVFVRW